MTSVRALIDQFDDTVELSAEPERHRWEAFAATVQALNQRCDVLTNLVENRALWAAAASAPTAEERAAILAEAQVRLRGQVKMLVDALDALNRLATECQLKQQELRENTSLCMLKAIEGFFAYRPPEVAVAARPGAARVDLFARPTTRVDLFNPGLGEPQPPPGPPDMNDGHADPNVEDRDGVVRARPLVRPDLVKDPTGNIQISNM